jgi:hypothetical protein
VEEEEPEEFPTTMIFIAVAIVVAITLITVAIVRGRRHAEYERRARMAHKKREKIERENAERDARERLIMEGYERGYRDSESDQFERATRVYDDLSPAPPEFEQPYRGDEYELPDESDGSDELDGIDEHDESDEPEKPFSVDDIE